MTSVLPRSFGLVYALDENLREDSPLLPVETSAPNEADRDELLLRKIGPRGWGRLHYFRNFYSEGWGDGNAGKPLSPRSVEAFYKFIDQTDFPPNSEPSLFLTDQGNLELCWEDAAGKAIQVEFSPRGAEFYLEAEDREDFCPYLRLPELAHELTRA